MTPAAARRSGSTPAKKAAAKTRASETAATKRPAGAAGRKRGVTWDWVRETMLALPGVEEGTSYGTPALRIQKFLLCRFHQDGKSLVVPVDPEDREILVEVDPESFYLTDHYRNYPYMLARLASVDPGALRDLLEDAWRRHAPKRLVGDYEGRSR
jgi:hypothetical protein